MGSDMISRPAVYTNSVCHLFWSKPKPQNRRRCLASPDQNQVDTSAYTSLSCLSQPRCIKSGASQGASNQVPAKVHQIDSLEIRVDECKRQVGRMVADLRLVICMPERLGQRIPRHGSATGCPTCCISRPAASQTLFIVYIFENLSNICTRGWGE